MADKSSDEDDYMSDAFLVADTRPGLLSREASRKHQQSVKIKEKNAKYKTIPKKQLEQEKRTEGLEKPIGSENKGFALLQKMGYKPGMAIGKKGQGRSEPIPVQLKNDRGGLGRDEEKKRKAEEMNQMRAQMMHKRRRNEQFMRHDFRERFTVKKKEARIESDLWKSQKACFELDAEKGYSEPTDITFWPPQALKKETKEEEEEGEEEEEEEEEEEPSELKLERLTKYLRETYMYCGWCGIRFEDAADLSANCPGDTRNAHEDEVHESQQIAV